MPNGPRPATLSQPASAVRPNAPSTPTMLQRQATSLYSNFSTSTGPVLVYGKAATPLAGDWSAEPWSPAGFEEPRQLDQGELDAMHGDVPLEAARMDTEDTEPTFDEETVDASSVADTAPFAERQESATPAIPAPASTPISESDSQPKQPEPSATETRPNQHYSVVYRHDPYSMYGQREVFRCFCDDCLSRAVTGNDAVYGDQYVNSSNAAPAEAAPGHGYSSMEYGNPAAAETYWSSAPEPEPEQPSSAFMPPPPPPRITRRVLAESSEPSLDVDAAFYHISMRWYSKVSQTQDRFVSTDDQCPPPGSPDQTFLEWIDEVGRWWLRNFEHRQTKMTPSAALLRSSYTAAQARASGFATHVSKAPALKAEPRRQFGTSGLSADLLAQHDRSSNLALPTPRSLEQRRCEELPW